MNGSFVESYQKKMSKEDIDLIKHDVSWNAFGGWDEGVEVDWRSGVITVHCDKSVKLFEFDEQETYDEAILVRESTVRAYKKAINSFEGASEFFRGIKEEFEKAVREENLRNLSVVKVKEVSVEMARKWRKDWSSGALKPRPSYVFSWHVGFFGKKDYFSFGAYVKIQIKIDKRETMRRLKEYKRSEKYKKEVDEMSREIEIEEGEKDQPVPKEFLAGWRQFGD